MLHQPWFTAHRCGDGWPDYSSLHRFRHLHPQSWLCLKGEKTRATEWGAAGRHIRLSQPCLVSSLATPGGKAFFSPNLCTSILERALSDLACMFIHMRILGLGHSDRLSLVMRTPWFGVGEAIPHLPTGDIYDGEGTLNSSKRRAVLAEKNSKRPCQAGTPMLVREAGSSVRVGHSALVLRCRGECVALGCPLRGVHLLWCAATQGKEARPNAPEVPLRC